MVERVLTNHFPLRWLTRIDGLSTMEAKANLDHERVSKEVAKAMAHAEYIATATIGNNEPARYYLANDIVIVVSEDDKAYVTTWRIEYGLPDGMDKTFRESLTLAIQKEREALSLSIEEDNMIVESYVQQQQDIRRDIHSLKKDLKALEEHEATLGNMIKTISNNRLPEKIQLERHVKQLLNSKDMWKSFQEKE